MHAHGSPIAAHAAGMHVVIIAHVGTANLLQKMYEHTIGDIDATKHLFTDASGLRSLALALLAQAFEKCRMHTLQMAPMANFGLSRGIHRNSDWISHAYGRLSRHREYSSAVAIVRCDHARALHCTCEPFMLVRSTPP